MEKKKCSCCGSEKMVYVTGLSYTVKPGQLHSGMVCVPFSSEDSIKDTYVCADCGHIEKFLKEDSQLMELVKEKAKNTFSKN